MRRLDAVDALLPKGRADRRCAAHPAVRFGRIRGFRGAAPRLPATTAVVQANRTNPPDAILREVYERTGDRPFGAIEEVISTAERTRFWPTTSERPDTPQQR